uniref:SEC24 homolog B, COPII coat complex component n=1 Tax=Mastacembelus armatus TaxID=205130 RepID=A0A7N8WXI2_9TELE
MSAPGFTNLNSYSQNSTPNGGAAPPGQNGPAQTYSSMYPPAGYYGAPPQQQGYPTTTPGHSAAVPHKSPITNSSHSGVYYHNNQQQLLPQHHVASSPYSEQRHPPYAPPGSYYGQQSYHAPPSQHPQQPRLVPVAAGGPGAPVYPIVSYPTAPGSSQYGTLSSSQSTSRPGAMPTLMGAPLHQYSTSQPVSTTAVQPGYSVAPSGQLTPTMNGSTGGDTSSSTTGSASPVPNSYDSLEGGSYPGITTMTKIYRHVCFLAHPSLQPFPNLSQLSAALGGLSGVPELEVEALRPVNLLQERNLLPPRPLEDKIMTFRCTLSSIPHTQALLNKARLPLGLLLHPFRDLQQLPVITSNTIVRCRSCRTYINPFVTFLDQRRWKCNLCYRVNDVPDEFMYNPVTRSYGEPHKRPEVQNATVEFIASSDYMLRPPQPAVYLFVLDVSHNAVEAGYLKYFCESLLENLDKLPGDTRTRVGFLTFDSTIHFYNLQEGLSQPQMLVVSDIDDIFIPSHDSLMVNLKESKELVKDLLTSLPRMFSQSRETHSALGPALQAAFKLMVPTGGRVSVFQTQLPTRGAGTLQSREDPNQRSSKKGVQHLGPATDFYKKLALDCSGQQIGVDLFLLSSQYADLASLACMSKYSAGSIFYYPSFHCIHNPAELEKFQKDLERYLTRKIGFEAVMRIRCTKGLSIHTFHGNFFVRSTDLLSLANVNPDSAFAVQMSIDDSLADSSLACFQAALLYTSSKGKRRIRVHTLCLPVVNQLSEVYAGADVQAITCLLANMAIDRSISSSLLDARDALVNAVVDLVSAYKSNVSNLQQSGLVLPAAMRLFPLYILALLKQKALRTGTSTRLDERVFAMCEFKTQPLQQLTRMVHPDLYRLDNMSDQGALHLNDTVVPQPHLVHLSAERLSRDGAFLMDCGNVFYLWIGKCCNEMFIRDVLGCPNYASVPPNMSHIPELETHLSERVRAFLDWLQDNRAFSSSIHVVKDDASAKATFFQNLVEDRSDSASSYYEFLQHIQLQMAK